MSQTVDSVFQTEEQKKLLNRVTIVDCPEVITNEEAPVMAVRHKKQSAIVDGMLKLRDGEVDAFVSAGSTGAVLAGGMFRLGRLHGVERPALAPLLPNGKDFFLLIDCGANVGLPSGIPASVRPNGHRLYADHARCGESPGRAGQ